jgi:hypothetical protein
MHEMNLGRYLAKITFRSKECGKDDFYLFLSIINPLLESLELVHILGFIVFSKN